MLPKIAPQPGFLRRAAVTATHGLDPAIGVQHHDVPVAQIVTVVAFAGGTRLRTPIFEITDGGAIVIFVTSQCGLRAVLEPAPGLLIAVPKLIGASSLVSQIPSSKDRAGNLLNQPGGGLGALEMLAAGDVARANQE
jgi:hypothetical protein